MAPRLIDLRPERRTVFHTSMDLVPVDTRTCPRCRHELTGESLFQDALVRHGGYGGTQRVDTEWCPCGFERVVCVATERPPR